MDVHSVTPTGAEFQEVHKGNETPATGHSSEGIARS
jgi:hypothetical protein